MIEIVSLLVGLIFGVLAGIGIGVALYSKYREERYLEKERQFQAARQRVEARLERARNDQAIKKAT